MQTRFDGPWTARDGNCPVAETITMLSGKWKPMMVHMLATQELHFEEIVRLLPEVNRKVVSQQLSQLVTDGLISRTAYSDGRQRVRYALTDNGRGLVPILEMMMDWQLAANRELQPTS